MITVHVPVEAERVLKQAALTCATRHFEDDSKEELAQLTALLQKFNIDTKAKKSNTMLAENLMLRAGQGLCNPRNRHFKRRAGHMALRHCNWGRALGFVYAPRFNFKTP